MVGDEKIFVDEYDLERKEDGTGGEGRSNIRTIGITAGRSRDGKDEEVCF